MSVSSALKKIIHGQIGLPLAGYIRSEDGAQKLDVVVSEMLDGALSGTPIDLATNDLGRDAWGRPKVINDYSLFSALWTLGVPNRLWLQYNNTGSGFVEQSAIDNSLVKSTKGHLEITGNSTTDVALVSKRHPRYQPNRGFLYSTAVIFPNPNYVGKRNWGLITTENGLFFQLEGDGNSWTLSIVRRTTEIGVTTDTVVDITSLLPDGFDISKGHVYDLQMEWRGVGDFYVFIDLSLIYTFHYLGKLTELSISNPALHIGWQCIGAAVGNDLVLRAGCVDVTSEGGEKQGKLYSSESTGTTMLSVNNSGKALLAIRLPVFISYDGATVRYTRDMILSRWTSFCKDEAFRTLYYARLIAATNLNALAGWNVADDSFYEWRTNSDGALDTAFQADKANMHIIFSARNEKDFSISYQNPDPEDADFYLTGGDVIVVEIKSDGTSTAGCTLEFAEEV